MIEIKRTSIGIQCYCPFGIAYINHKCTNYARPHKCDQHRCRMHNVMPLPTRMTTIALQYLHSTSKNRLNTRAHPQEAIYGWCNDPLRKRLKWRVYPLQNQLLLLRGGVPLLTGIAHCSVSTCMNKTIATYKAHLKALHTRVKASISDSSWRSYFSTIDRGPLIFGRI